MGCINITKCFWKQVQKDDDSSESCSINIISQCKKPSGSTAVPDKAPKLGGSSKWSLNWDATKSYYSRSVFTLQSRQFNSQCSTMVSTTIYSDFSMTEITSQLYLGSFEDAKNEAKVIELGITHILSLIGPKHPIKGIKHMHRPMNDNGNTNLKRLIKKIWPFVMNSQRPGNKLCVHCLSGQNRSATVMISILMKLKGEPNKLVDVYKLVKDKRPVIQITELYAKQLLELERDLFGTTTMSNDWMKIRSCDSQTGSVLFFE